MRAVAVLVLCLGFLVTPSSASVWLVDPHGGGDFVEIQPAILHAVPGDEIVVHPGTYYENLDFLGKDLYLHSSAGAESTIIDGSRG